MREFKYENGIIRITTPTKDQEKNLRKATEFFLKKLLKDGMIQNDNNSKTRTIKTK